MKKIKFWILIIVLVLLALADGLLTFINTPDLFMERNPLVAKFGFGWETLAIAGLGFSGLYALIIARAILVFEWLCITFNASWANAYFTFRNTYCFGRVDVFVAMYKTALKPCFDTNAFNGANQRKP